MASVVTKETVKTRILFISDTHSYLPSESHLPNQPFSLPLPKADVLVHCGDLTMNGSLEQHRNAVKLLDSIQADLKIVIPGNHDLTLHREYYDKHYAEHTRFPKYSDEILAEIKDMYAGDMAASKGIVYLEEGTAQYHLKNGAQLKIYASAWTPEFFNWAFGYPHSSDRYNPSCLKDSRHAEFESAPKNPVSSFGSASSVDLMVTHGPPLGILDKTRHGLDVGCAHLRRAVERCRPKIHAFGHIHEGHGALWKIWDTQGLEPSGSIGATLDAPTLPESPFWNTNCMRPPVPGETLVVAPSYKEQIEGKSAYINAASLEHGKSTLFINSSIMTVKYEPRNAPWLVDIELEKIKKFH